MSTVVSKTDQLTNEEVNTVVSTTENLEERQFEMLGDSVNFFIKEDEEGNPEELRVKISHSQYGIDAMATMQAFNTAKISESLIDTYDYDLLLPLVNHYFSNKGGELKALIKKDKVKAFVRPGTELYSLTDMLSEIVRAVKSHGIEEFYFDKIHHDLMETQICLVIPHKTFTLSNGDVLRAGIQLQHSVLGKRPTVLSGYLSRDYTNNGMISVLSTEKWDRKAAKTEAKKAKKQEQPEVDPVTGMTFGSGYDVYTWCFDTADSILRLFEKDAKSVESLIDHNVGSHAGTFFNDIFKQFGVPVGVSKLVREEYADQLDHTLYGLWKALTLTADREELVGHTANIRRMMVSGGLLANHPDSCSNCHRLTELDE